MLTFFLERRLFGLIPSFYHLTNIILNLITTFLAFFLFSQFLPLLPAFFATLFFSLHPTHLESVAFISGRTDILMTIFLLSAFLSLLAYKKRRKSIFLFTTSLFFFLALLAKENALFFPLLFLILFPKREWQREKIFLLSLFSLTLIYLIIRFLVLKGFSTPWSGVSFQERFFLFLNGFGRYSFLAFFPFLHKLTYSDIADFTKIGFPTFFALFSLFILLFFGLKSSLSKKTGAIIFLFSLLPACNLFPPGASYLSERLLYLPTLGLSLFLFSFWNFPKRSFLMPFILFYLGAMALNLWSRLPIYQDDFTLMAVMAKEDPKNYLPHIQLGGKYLKEGKLDEAIAEFKKAVELKPNDAEGYARLANVLLEKGRIKEAIQEYEKANRLKPLDPIIKNNLGVAYQELGDLAQAEKFYREALALKPDLSLALNNLGEIFLKQNKIDSALIQFQKALKSDPNYTLAHYNLGLAYHRLGDFARAESSYQRVLEIMPDFLPAKNALKEIKR
ncbi:MAG: tetratricopeptide repeat protein [candidate division WOR-3 bacterium]